MTGISHGNIRLKLNLYLYYVANISSEYGWDFSVSPMA